MLTQQRVSTKRNFLRCISNNNIVNINQRQKISETINLHTTRQHNRFTARAVATTVSGSSQ